MTEKIVTSITYDDSGVQAAAKRIVSANNQIVTSTEQVAQATDKVSGANGRAALTMREMVPALVGRAAAFERLKKSMDPIYDATKKMEKGIKDADAAILRKTAKETDATAVLEKYAVSSEHMRAAILQNASAFGALGPRLQEVVRNFQAVEKAAEEAARKLEEIDKAAASFDRLRGSVEPVYAATQAFEKATREGKMAMDAGRISAEQYAAVLSKVATSSDAMRAAVRAGAGGVAVTPARKAVADFDAAEINAQAARDAEQLARATEQLRIAADPAYAAEQRLAEATRTLDAALKAGNITLEQRAALLGKIATSSEATRAFARSGGGPEARSAVASYDSAEAAARAAKETDDLARATDQLRRSIDPAYASQRRLEEGTRTLDAALRHGMLTTEQHAHALDRLARAGQRANLGGGLREAFAAFKEYQIGNMSAGLGAIGIALGTMGPAGAAAVIGITAAVAALRQLITAADEAQAVRNTLNLVMPSADAAAAAFKRLQDVSMETGATIGTLRDVFFRLTATQRDLGLADQDIIKVTRALAELNSMAGAIGPSAQGGMIQLGQALSSVRVQAEEWNSISMNLPALAQLFADNVEGAAGSVAKLKMMINDGKIAGRDLAQVLVRNADDINSKYQGMQKTVGVAMTIMASSIAAFIVEINNTTGATAKLADGIVWLARRFQDMKSGIEAARNAVTGFNTAVQQQLKGTVFEQVWNILVQLNAPGGPLAQFIGLVDQAMARIAQMPGWAQAVGALAPATIPFLPTSSLSPAEVADKEQQLKEKEKIKPTGPGMTGDKKTLTAEELKEKYAANEATRLRDSGKELAAARAETLKAIEKINQYEVPGTPVEQALEKRRLAQQEWDKYAAKERQIKEKQQKELTNYQTQALDASGKKVQALGLQLKQDLAELGNKEFTPEQRAQAEKDLRTKYAADVQSEQERAAKAGARDAKRLEDQAKKERDLHYNQMDYIDQQRRAIAEASDDKIKSLEIERDTELRGLQKRMADGELSTETAVEAEGLIRKRFDLEIDKERKKQQDERDKAAREELDIIEQARTAALGATGDRIAAIHAERDESIRALQDKMAEGKLSEEGYNQARVYYNQKASREIEDEERRRLEALNEARADALDREGDRVGALRLQQESERRRIAADGSFSEGQRSELLALNDKKYQGLVADAEQTRFRDFLEAQGPMVRDLADAFGDVGSQAVDAFTQAIIKGEELSEAIQGLAEDISVMITRMLIMKAVEGGLNAAVGSLGGSGAGTITGPSNAGTPVQMSGADFQAYVAAGMPLANAHGNVFAGGNVLPFARGGIVDRPTLFPMAQGMGLMGEAGPEGVLPLRRMPSGNLGVEAGGKGVVVNIINNTPSKVSTEEKKQPGGGMNLTVVIDAVEQAMAQRAARPGTTLNRSLTVAANPVRAR